MDDQKFHIMKDIDDVKWLTGTEFHFTMEDNFKQHAQLKRWCEENCEDMVAFLQGNYYERIYFYSEEDAMGYKLKWE